MSTVLIFPVERRAPPPRRRPHGRGVSADVVILPAVRIERIAEPEAAPISSETPSGRKSACASERGPSWP